MICGRCGAQLNTNATVCAACGAQGSGVEQIKRRRPDRFDLIGLLVCGIAVALVYLGILGVRGFRSPEKAAEGLIVGWLTGDAEACYHCIPAFEIRSGAEELGVADKGRRAWIDARNDAFDRTGRSACTVSSAKAYYDAALLSEFKSNLRALGATYQEIAEIKEYSLVKVNAVIDGESVDLVAFCVKIGRRWYGVDWIYSDRSPDVDTSADTDTDTDTGTDPDSTDPGSGQARLGVTLDEVEIGLLSNRIYATCEYPTEGALVVDMDPFAAVYYAGLDMYDIITAFDGHPVNSPADLVVLLSRCRPGQTVDMTVFTFYDYFDRGFTRTITFELEAAE